MTKHRIYKDSTDRAFDVRENGECRWTVEPIEPIPTALYESVVIEVQSPADYYSVVPLGGGGVSVSSIEDALAAATTMLWRMHRAPGVLCRAVSDWMDGG